jgi:hypothetical protein
MPALKWLRLLLYHVPDKGFDLSYLLFKMKQGKPEELSSGTILRALRQQRKNAE